MVLHLIDTKGGTEIKSVISQIIQFVKDSLKSFESSEIHCFRAFRSYITLIYRHLKVFIPYHSTSENALVGGGINGIRLFRELAMQV